MKTINEIKETHTRSHTSLATGYISVKGDGIISEYSGRFGVGYIHHEHNPSSTKYKHITYYITK